MDVKQKYTEEFEIDEMFLIQMRNFNNGSAEKIGGVIDTIYGIESTKGFIKNMTGNVMDNKGNPVFFSFDYYREDDGPIVLVDVYHITLDEYLDSINLNLNIKQ